MICKIIILSLLSGFWLLTTFASAAGEFSYYDRLFIGGMLVSVLAVQAVIIRCCRRYVSNIMLAVFAVANMVAWYLAFYTPFTALHGYQKILAVAAAVFIAHSFWQSLDDKNKWSKAAPMLAVLLFCGAAGKAAVTEWKRVVPEKFAPRQAGMTSSPAIRLVDFVSRPNVYIFAFDALIPRSLAARHLHVSRLPYQSHMEEAGFRIFRNFFVDAVYTEKSLSNFLSLGRDYYNNQGEKSKYAGSFSGLIPSPLLEIFKANGYVTNTYYNDYYFGQKSGKYVDNYRVNIPFAACSFLQGDSFFLAFWGYCPLLALAVKNNTGDIVQKAKTPYLEFLQRNFFRRLAAAKPAITVAYLWSPGHTPANYGHSAEEFSFYQKKFAEGVRLAAARIKFLTEFVRRHDPGALLFIFGDHGPRLSRSRQWQQLNSRQDKKFFIQDNYGVLGGLYPGDACAEYFAKPLSPEYTTPAQVGRQIVRCLSGGKDPFIAPMEYHLDYDEHGYTDKTPTPYEEYLYE